MLNLSARVKRLQELMEEKFLDAVFTASPNDIYYYTGYRILGGGFLIIDTISSKPMLIVTTLDNEAEDIKGCRVKFISKAEDIKRLLNFYERIGIDENGLKASTYIKMEKLDIKPATELIKQPRMIKDEYELEQLKNSIRITAGVFRGLEISGKSEIRVSGDAIKMMIDAESSPSFDPLIATGKNSYFVHHVPGKEKIRKSEPTIVDIGSVYNCYASDITRMLVPKDSASRKVYEDVLDLQAFLIDNIKPGNTFEYINSLYEKFLKEKGYKSMHSFGHGVGLNVHERPFGKDKLKEGMVLTVEPGIYIKNKGGFRVEDMILVTKDKPKVMSRGVRQELG